MKQFVFQSLWHVFTFVDEWLQAISIMLPDNADTNKNGWQQWLAALKIFIH